MTHRVIIIDQNSATSPDYDPTKPEVRLVIPVPHDATANQTGNMVEVAVRALNNLPGAH